MIKAADRVVDLMEALEKSVAAAKAERDRVKQERAEHDESEPDQPRALRPESTES